MLDDAQLIRQYAETGSQSAFKQLVERHFGLVYYSAMRQLNGDAHLAHDVAQSVFLLMATKAKLLRTRISLAGWLYAATYYKASRLARAERRRRIREGENPALEIELSEAEVFVDWSVLRSVLDRAAMSLPKLDRELLLLRFFEARTYAEIAASTDLSEGTAQKRVERALERLRKVLSRQGIVSTSSALAVALSTNLGRAAPNHAMAELLRMTLPRRSPFQLPIGHHWHVTLSKVGISGVVAGFVGVVVIAFAAYKVERSRGAQIPLPQAIKRNVFGTGGGANSAGLQAHPSAGTTRSVTRRIDVSKDDGREFLEKYPEARRFMATAGLAQLRHDFGLFFIHANLSPAQTEAFEERVEQIKFRSAPFIAPSGAVVPSGPQLTPDALTDVLDESAMDEFRDYLRKFTAIRHAMEVFDAASNVGSPLSVHQVAAIADCLAQNDSSYRNGVSFAMDSVDWSKAIAGIRGNLDSAQWEVAEGVIMSWQCEAELQSLRRRAGNDGPTDMAALVAAHPTIRDLYSRAFHAQLVRHFGPICRELHLSADQTANFERIAREHDLDKRDLQAAAQEQHLDFADPYIKGVWQDENAAFRSRIALEVSPVLGRRLEESVRLNAAQELVDLLAGMESVQIPPFSKEERVELVTVLANSSLGYRAGGNVDLSDSDWPSVLAQAAAILPSSKLGLFDAATQLERTIVLVRKFYSEKGKSD